MAEKTAWWDKWLEGFQSHFEMPNNLYFVHSVLQILQNSISATNTNDFVVGDILIFEYPSRSDVGFFFFFCHI